MSNPKELEDLQKDVESLKRRRIVLDDEAFAAMERLDEAERARDEAIQVDAFDPETYRALKG